MRTSHPHKSTRTSHPREHAPEHPRERAGIELDESTARPWGSLWCHCSAQSTKQSGGQALGVPVSGPAHSCTPHWPAASQVDIAWSWARGESEGQGGEAEHSQCLTSMAALAAVSCVSLSGAIVLLALRDDQVGSDTLVLEQLQRKAHVHCWPGWVAGTWVCDADDIPEA